MIGEDRIRLNNRFVEVFKHLELRGDIVKNDRGGKGMGDFAEKILGNRGYGHIISAFLNEKDKRVIDYKHARRLCKEYGVNETYMFEGTGTPFGMDLPDLSPISASNTPLHNILFTTVEAFAGSGQAMGQLNKERLSYFSMPGLQGDSMVAFPITGNSMDPVIRDGDMVVCKEVGLLSDVRDNKIYAVKSNGSLWIKYVQRIMDGHGIVRRLKLISANHLEYDPFVEEVNEHTRLYQVIRRISEV
ncbi:MAG: S24 family peptidase [Bacteroidota bacterium]